MSVGKKVRRPKLYRNKFNLSHERRLSADMFYLYPVLVDDVIPGDIWRIGNEIVVRMNPLVAPIMHEINVFIHYYFVPNRLLWDQWEDYITGGRDGNFVAPEPRVPVISFSCGSLYDHLGFGDISNSSSTFLNVPLAYPLYAYNLIFNEYYRDPNLEDPVSLYFVDDTKPNSLHVRCWEKDYFTSMLPWQQRGDAPSIPITFEGTVPLNWGPFRSSPFDNSQVVQVYPGNVEIGATSVPATTLLSQWFDTARLDVSELNDVSYTFDVNDMRLMFQIQKYLERNARVGPRYVEQLRGRYGSSPTDDRLQRPEYIGGSKTPIIISEVLQTSETTINSPQGRMAGHGLSADRTYCGTYKCREHGVIMGIMSIMPKPMYMQGVDRVWLKSDKFDYPHPEFVNLSEQAVKQSEIYNLSDATDRIIGYQGRYDEYRWKRSTVHGLFRTTSFMSWHMARSFDDPPTLNLDLVRPNFSERDYLKRGLAVDSEDMFLITLGNKCHVTRSLPYMAEPGLIDHN